MLTKLLNYMQLPLVTGEAVWVVATIGVSRTIITAGNRDAIRTVHVGAQDRIARRVSLGVTFLGNAIRVTEPIESIVYGCENVTLVRSHLDMTKTCVHRIGAADPGERKSEWQDPIESQHYFCHLKELYLETSSNGKIEIHTKRFKEVSGIIVTQAKQHQRGACINLLLNYQRWIKSE
jgi:hypothetical protein